jgi:hypothetical protein
MQRVDDDRQQVEAGVASGDALAAFLALDGVWTDDNQDGAGTLGRAADVGDVGRPGVLLINVRAALRSMMTTRTGSPVPGS